MDDLLLLGHLGLGDHIICNGLVRELCKKNNITLICKKQYQETLEIMFCDLQNLSLISVEDDLAAIKYFNDYSKYYEINLRLGHFGQNFMKGCFSFDESFYKQAKIDYNNRWEKFYFDLRSIKQIEPDMKNYIFVHDDSSRNFNIKIDSPCEIFRPQFKKTVFHYLDVIKDAKEIHCIDSSFAVMIDHFDFLKNKKKFIHRYIRKDTLNPQYRNDWNILYE